MPGRRPVVVRGGARWTDDDGRRARREPTIGPRLPRIGALLDVHLFAPPSSASCSSSFAIPFGLMLAPLAIGIIVLVVALRRLDGEFAIRDGSAA